jgi:hypothetical protein
MGTSSLPSRPSAAWRAAALALACATAAGAVDFVVQSNVFKRPVNFLENGNVYAHGRVFSNVPATEMPGYWGSLQGPFKVMDAAGTGMVAALVDNHIFLTGSVFQNQNAFPGNVKIRRSNGTEIASFGTNGNLYIDNALTTNANCLAPVFEPQNWNDFDDIQFNDNCYNYGNNQLTYTFAQPGRASGGTAASMTVALVRTAALNDGLTWVGWTFPGNTYTCPGAGTLVFMTVAIGSDYHWYRLDKAAGKWTHKPGGTEATDRDHSNNLITNPLLADRNYGGSLNYTENGGFYCTCGSDANVR